MNLQKNKQDSHSHSHINDHEHTAHKHCTGCHKHEHEEKADLIKEVKIAVCIISDSRTYATDETGQMLIEKISQTDSFVKSDYTLIKNDENEINRVLDNFLKSESIVLITSGGTGLSSKDITIDTISRKYTKTLSGFGEIFRLLSYEEIGVRAMMSRAAAGVISDKLIISLPGSKNAVKLAYEKIIAPQLKHIIYEITR